MRSSNTYLPRQFLNGQKSSVYDRGNLTWYEPLPVKTALSAGDDLLDSERAPCLWWNSFPFKQITYLLQASLNVNVNNLRFQTVEVSHGMNLYRSK